MKKNTSLAAPGALAHRLQHLTARLIQNGRWGLKEVKPSDQLSLNKFFDSMIPSVITSKIQNGHQGSENGRQGLEMGLLLDFWALSPT